MLNKLRRLLITLMFSLLYVPASAAQELHAGDMQPWRVGAEILVNSTLFEADFGDPSGGSFATDEPGIDVDIEKGAFTPGNWLRFQPLGQLLYWNGTQWSTAIPNGERIEITDALNNAISYSATGTNGTAGVIGEVSSDGRVHEHLSFKIFDVANTPNGTPGAYRIQLRLFESNANSDTSVSIATSPIAIVFNRGLEQGSFELAVAAANDLTENSVFVADTGILTIQRVKALGTYYQAKLQHIGDGKFQLIEVHEITATQ